MVSDRPNLQSISSCSCVFHFSSFYELDVYGKGLRTDRESSSLRTIRESSSLSPSLAQPNYLIIKIIIIVIIIINKIIIIIIMNNNIIYHDILPPPRREISHTHNHQDTPLSPYTWHLSLDFL